MIDETFSLMSRYLSLCLDKYLCSTMAIRLDLSRYPRACHLICLKVGGEPDGLEGESSSMSPNADIPAAAGAGELQTSSRGQGRAMHGQRMVEWLQVRRIGAPSTLGKLVPCTCPVPTLVKIDGWISLVD